MVWQRLKVGNGRLRLNTVFVLLFLLPACSYTPRWVMSCGALRIVGNGCMVPWGV